MLFRYNCCLLNMSGPFLSIVVCWFTMNRSQCFASLKPWIVLAMTNVSNSFHTRKSPRGQLSLIQFLFISWIPFRLILGVPVVSNPFRRTIPGLISLFFFILYNSLPRSGIPILIPLKLLEPLRTMRVHSLRSINILWPQISNK